jgi:hypothetical protein
MNSFSQTFSFARWWLLVSKHWSENRKRYLLFLLAIAGLLLAWFSFILIISRPVLVDTNFQFTTYYIGLFLVGCLYASTLFSELSSKREGISYLALPASQFEKLLCALFYGVVLFFTAYTLVFYLVDIPLVQLSNSILEKYPRNFSNSSLRIGPSIVYNIFTAAQGPIPEKDFHLFLCTFFSAQAVFILGSLYYTRYAFIKSIIAVLVCALLYIIIEAKLIGSLLPPGWDGDFFNWVHIDADGHPDKLIYLPNSLGRMLTLLIQVTPPFIVYTITYLRLKEKEV